MVGFHGFRVSVHSSVICPSVCISFIDIDDNLSKHQLIFTKLGMCFDIVELWFRIATGQISSNYDEDIYPRNAHIFISGQ